MQLKKPIPVLIVGAGPAGLTAAYELMRRGVECAVVEADPSTVGGISRTEARDGWRFDIGGHRFFTKVPRVEEFWNEILGDEDFLLRKRMSRIYYKEKFFDYPLRVISALRGLGVAESFRCVLSYAWVRVRPPRDKSTFEGWVAARFGWRLYRIFFKTYTEKVWGVPATQIHADWAAQRIRNLSLGTALLNALWPGRNKNEVTSLIEEFRYPKLGPGMMWEACANRLRNRGVEIHMGARVMHIRRDAEGGDLLVTVTDTNSVVSGVNNTVGGGGRSREVRCEQMISSMALSALVQALPDVPELVRVAARGLRYRDFLTVALVVPAEFTFPDNWIYIHSPEVQLGRVQNYGSWSPYLVKDGLTCLGLEYFVNEGDDLWSRNDEDMISFGTSELEKLGLLQPGSVERGFVVRMPKAYPVYDAEYAAHVETLRKYLEAEWPEIHTVGRNGMHRYNNQDHSMLTAMLTAENIADGTDHDIWSVNVEPEYQEELDPRSREAGGAPHTGRAAPLLPSNRVD